jgi:hypothetical protein
VAVEAEQLLPGRVGVHVAAVAHACEREGAGGRVEDRREAGFALGEPADGGELGGDVAVGGDHVAAGADLQRPGAEQGFDRRAVAPAQGDRALADGAAGPQLGADLAGVVGAAPQAEVVAAAAQALVAAVTEERRPVVVHVDQPPFVPGAQHEELRQQFEQPGEARVGFVEGVFGGLAAGGLGLQQLVEPAGFVLAVAACPCGKREGGQRQHQGGAGEEAGGDGFEQAGSGRGLSAGRGAGRPAW